MNHLANTGLSSVGQRQKQDCIFSLEPEAIAERVLAQHPKGIEVIRSIAKAISSEPPEPDYPDVIPQVLLVGGLVRDAVVGISSKDLDIEVYGMRPARVKEVLERLYGDRVSVIGKFFPILHIKVDDTLPIDVMIPRDGSAEERSKFESGDPSLTPRDAAHLSDFTINSLLADPFTGEVFDCWGAIEDLKSGVLRVFNQDFFRENPLHLYRAVRFAARFELQVDPSSMEFMRTVVEPEVLETIHPFRIFDQLEGLLLRTARPSIGLDVFRELGLIEASYPELSPLLEEKVWAKALRAVDLAAQLYGADSSLSEDERLALMFCSFFLFLDSPQQKGAPLSGFVRTREFFSKFRQMASCTNQVLSALAHLPLLEKLSKEMPKQEKAKPSAPQGGAKRGPARGGMLPRGGNSSATVPKRPVFSQELERLISDAQPASWRLLLALAEVKHRIESGRQESWKPAARLSSQIEKERLDEVPRTTLIAKEDLTKTLKVSPGAHVGFLIGEIEKRRGELLTKENALGFLRQNLDAMLEQYQEQSPQ